MPSTQFRRAARTGAALLDLHRKVSAGQAFGEALAAVAVTFGIDPDQLRRSYHSACRELAAACNDIEAHFAVRERGAR